MTKKHKRIVTDPNQLSLFDLLIQEQQERADNAPGRMCVSSQLLVAVRMAIRQAPKSRETLADEMSELTGQTISVHQVNNWTAESHPHRMPAEFIPALCESTGCLEPVRVLAEAAGVFTLPGADALRSEVQKLREEERKISAERRRRELFLRELEG